MKEAIKFILASILTKNGKKGYSGAQALLIIILALLAFLVLLALYPQIVKFFKNWSLPGGGP